MDPLNAFIAYARDFEQTFDDDDWTRLERHFAPEAVYEVRNAAFGCRIEGRDSILRGFKKSLDGFDRKMPKRTVAPSGMPVVNGDRLTVDWTATYEKPDAPVFVLRGRSRIRYRGDVIVELVDEYPDGMDAEAADWSRKHAPGVDASYV